MFQLETVKEEKKNSRSPNQAGEVKEMIWSTATGITIK